MNEIVAFAGNYSLTDSIRAFVYSSKKHCDKLTVLTLNIASDLNDFLIDNSVNVLDVHEIASKFKVNLSLSLYTLKVIFYFLYLKYYSAANVVFLPDFTDVIVQKNPFDLVRNNLPYVSGECEIIGNCQVNQVRY